MNDKIANSSTCAWDPKSYLQFKDHRTRPASELIGRIKLKTPEKIYDLGCGPGNSTALLRRRWPDAEITGIDSSQDMLLEAKDLEIGAHWRLENIEVWKPKTKPHLIFSNAALQWLGNHEELFSRLLGFLKPGGVLAVQMPRNFTSPSHTIIQRVVEDGPWSDRLKHVRNFEPVGQPEDYYNVLADNAEPIDIWETEYVQALAGEDAVFSWLSATALLPFVSELKGREQSDFVARCRRELGAVYRPRDDNVTLFSFRRLFIVAVAN